MGREEKMLREKFLKRGNFGKGGKLRNKNLKTEENLLREFFGKGGNSCKSKEILGRKENNRGGNCDAEGKGRKRENF